MVEVFDFFHEFVYLPLPAHDAGLYFLMGFDKLRRCEIVDLFVHLPSSTIGDIENYFVFYFLCILKDFKLIRLAVWQSELSSLITGAFIVETATYNELIFGEVCGKLVFEFGEPKTVSVCNSKIIVDVK